MGFSSSAEEGTHGSEGQASAALPAVSGESVSFWAGRWCLGTRGVTGTNPPESLSDPKCWLSLLPAFSLALRTDDALTVLHQLSLIKPPTPLPRVGVH